MVRPVALGCRRDILKNEHGRDGAVPGVGSSAPREALGEAMGRALDALTARDARGFFDHRGYRVAGQLL